jgi:hypothetical protein
MADMRNAKSAVFVGKAEGKRQLGIPRRRWENNIKWTLMKQNVLM